jgi:two-component system, NtrC family, sensor histidine kinase PilS
MDSERLLEIRRRLMWIAAVRGMLCLFTAAIVRLNVQPSPSMAKWLPYAIVAGAFVLNLAYLGLAHTRMRWSAVAGAQTITDVVFITALVSVTGGVSSDFRLLYFGPILASAVLFSRSAALLVASFATIGLFSTAALYALGEARLRAFVDATWPTPETTPGLAGFLALQAAAFHLVAYLAATLTWRLRSASIETEHILENMSDGVITVAKDGRVVFANVRAREMLALERGRALIGASLAQIAPAAVSQAFVEVISSRQPVSVEVEMGRSPFPAQATVLPLSDQAGMLRGANVVLLDLTERRRLMEALRRADRLEATSMTVASIAHEIRNPLAAIRGSAQELKKALNVSGPDARLLDLVVRESDRLNRVITEFLKFSKRSKPQMAKFDLRQLLDEVAAELKVHSGGKGDVSVGGGTQVPASGDAEQLRQVFINLGLNALDATGGAGPVVFDVESAPAGVSVRTRDHGSGIDDSIREKVFEPFFTTKTTGTGLGLPIARQIVEDHSGTLEIEKGPDGWTCVKVSLPQAERGDGQKIKTAIRGVSGLA